MAIKGKGSRDLQMLLSAYYDLFSIKNYKPKANEIKNWLYRYKKRERFIDSIRN